MTHLHPRFFRLALLLAAALWLSGCDDGDGNDPGDATTDTESGDAAGDTTAPADTADATDPADTGVGDTGADTPGDTGSGDTGSGDTGSGDTGSGDTGSGDTSGTDTADGDAIDPPTGPWPHCPSGANAGDPGWPFTLQVDPGATYCAFYPEQRGFAEEYGRKVMLHLLPASHALPMESGQHAYTLPACGMVVGDIPLTSDGAGTVDVTRTTNDTFDTVNYAISQPLIDGDGQPWVIELTVQLEAYLPNGETLATQTVFDDGDPSIFDSANFNYGQIAVCQGSVCDWNSWETTRRMNSCTFANVQQQRVARVDFEGGWLETTTRIGQSFASTEPAIFYHGEGEIDGVPFASDDYFELVYSPWHHHFDMDQAVRFDAPITGQACGVYGAMLPAFDPMGDVSNLEAGLLDCEFNVLETRKVTGYSVTNVDL